MKILFISHDLSRTGAPNMLLQLIKWLTKNHDYDIDLVSLGNGGFYEDFNAVCNIIGILEEKPQKTITTLKNKVKRKIGLSAESIESKFLQSITNKQYDIIYANSALSLPLGAKIKSIIPNSKLISHVHEMEVMIKNLVPKFNAIANHVDLFIAASNPVKQNLTNTYSIADTKIKVINEFSDFEIPKSEKTSHNNAFVVGASGLSHWRKGNDLFLQVARVVKKNHPDANIKFVWVGKESHDKQIIRTDIKRLKLEDVVSFTGEQKDPFPFFNDFDVFLLTSREDPFPLVCIEVAKLQKPIICFKDASGTAEVIEKGGGKVVPYLDIETMAEMIMRYYNDNELLKKDAVKAKELFSKYTASEICPQIIEEIHNLKK